jgi:hypothetical protein
LRTAMLKAKKCGIQGFQLRANYVKVQGTIDYFRLTIDYCISTQRTQRGRKTEFRIQKSENRSQKTGVRESEFRRRLCLRSAMLKAKKFGIEGFR